jgi:hypothetical protein
VEQEGAAAIVQRSQRGTRAAARVAVERRLLATRSRFLEQMDSRPALDSEQSAWRARHRTRKPVATDRPLLDRMQPTVAVVTAVPVTVGRVTACVAVQVVSGPRMGSVELLAEHLGRSRIGHRAIRQVTRRMLPVTMPASEFARLHLPTRKACTYHYLSR